MRLLIAMCILCTGCAAHSKLYDKDNNLIYHVETSGSASIEYTTPDGYTVKTDSKMKSPLEGLISASGQKIIE